MGNYHKTRDLIATSVAAVAMGLALVPFALPGPAYGELIYEGEIPEQAPSPEAAAACSSSQTQVGNTVFTTLDFEGTGNLLAIPACTVIVGPDTITVTFTNCISLIDADAGGSGNFANEPSSSTIGFFQSGTQCRLTFDKLISDASAFVTSPFVNASLIMRAADTTLLGTAGPVTTPTGLGDPSGGTFTFPGAPNLTFDLGANTASIVDITGGAGQTGFDDITFSRIVVIDVDIDIKPGSFPNSINSCSKGAIPIAILGSASLDVTTIDPGTLVFAGAGIKIVGKTDKILCSVEDVSGPPPGPGGATDPSGVPDGFDDLVCHFVTIELTDIASGDATAMIEGALFDGTPLEGTDSINIVKDDCL